MINTVIFDLDDTLYDQLLPFKIAVESCFKEHVPKLPIEQLFVASRKYSDEVFDKSEQGLISLEELHTYRIISACKEFGIELSHDDAVKFQNIYRNQQEKIVLFPDMEKLLGKLVNHQMQLALLTNGPYEHQLMKIKQLGLTKWIPQQNLFISEAIGSAKPHPSAFHYVEEKLGLSNQATVYIGDSFQNDIVGARQVGWHAIWLNHRKKIATISVDYGNKLVFSAGELLQDRLLFNHNNVENCSENS